MRTDPTRITDVDLRGRQPPGYIAVEGAIGVGKTTLARRLAATFNYAMLAEDAEENPFLEKFYKNQRESALATQLFFYSSAHRSSPTCASATSSSQYGWPIS